LQYNYDSNERESKMDNKTQHVSRRGFLKTGAAISASAMLSPRSRVFAAGSDTMRVALIGCGSRGTKDAVDCLKSDEGVELVAMADIFKDRLDSSLANIRKQVPARSKLLLRRAFLALMPIRKSSL